MFLLPTPAARDWKSGASNLMDENSRPLNEWAVNTAVDAQWLGSNGKDYGPAVRRWEEITGHPAPCPTEAGAKSNRRLSPLFSEWMMGIGPGHVTDIVTDRNDALHVIGNGVVPRQAEAAFRFLMDDSNWSGEVDDSTKQEKPRGKCTGCDFDYQLSAKGLIRKHNSRTGPGLCAGANQPPEPVHANGCTEETRWGPSVCSECGECLTCVMDPDHCTEHFPPPADLVVTRVPDGQCGINRDVVAVAPGGIPVFSDPAPVDYAVSRDRNTRDSEDQGVSTPDVHPGDGVSGVDGVPQQGLRTDHGVRQTGEGSPADVPAMGGGNPGGALDRSPVPEHQVREPGSPGSSDAVGEHASAAPGHRAPQRGQDALPQRAPVQRGQHEVRDTGNGAGVQGVPGGVQSGVPGAAEDPFQLPGAASVIPDGSVSMQPEPDRDRWQRYLIHGKPHTRATTFAKAASSTFTLNEWQQRMTIAGLVLRPDLMALAHGLDVKRDRSQLNSIAEQAKEAAGQKVAANLGTAYHAFSERLDAGLITLADVPEQYRPRLAQFQETVRGAGLTTRTEWIERSTAVRSDQVSAALPVAGTLDRIYRLPNGELVIGDLKTGADLSYAWGEIAVQLALYAHGVNAFGLFDWRTKTWDTTLGLGTPDIKVRTDFAIVVHLPAGGDGCTLHKVDLVKGWERAQVCGQVMALQADKGALSHPFTPEMVPAELDAPPSPVGGEVAEMNHAWEHAKGVFRTATDQAHLAQLYQFAMDSGKFHTDQLATLVGIGKDRLNELSKGA